MRTVTWIWRPLQPALRNVSLPSFIWKKHIPVEFEKTNPVLLVTFLSCTYNQRRNATCCLKRERILQQLLKLFISTRWVQVPLKSTPTFFSYMNWKEIGWAQCGSYETEEKWDLAQWSVKYQWLFFFRNNHSLFFPEYAIEISCAQFSLWCFLNKL